MHTYPETQTIVSLPGATYKMEPVQYASLDGQNVVLTGSDIDGNADALGVYVANGAEVESIGDVPSDGLGMLLIAAHYLSTHGDVLGHIVEAEAAGYENLVETLAYERSEDAEREAVGIEARHDAATLILDLLASK